MRRAALLLLFAFPAVTRAQEACRDDLYTEVIRSEDIIRSGAARFSDLLALSDRWMTFSVDGYDWEATVTGFSDHQRWKIYVDDKLIPVGLLGKANLNLLPIHIHEVDCVELVGGPDAGGPQFSPFGSVRIYTRRPPPEVTLRGGVAAGNEVNDPGPFHYTPMRSPNIDRIGPIGVVDVSAAGPRGFARLSGTLDEFHVTDDQVDVRTMQLYTEDSKPSINVESAALTGRWQGHSTLLGRTRTHDLLFFPHVGIELPSTHSLEYAGAAGEIALSGAMVDYHASYLTHDLLQRPNRRNLRLDFGEQRVTGGAGVALGGTPLGLRIGGSAESITARTEQPLSDARILVTRLHSQLSLRRKNGRHTLFGEWLQSDARPAAAGFYRADVSLDSLNAVSVAVSYGRHLVESESGFWMWSGRGYALPESAPVVGIPFEPSPRFLTADLEWRTRPATGFRGTLRAYYRWFDGDYLPQYDLDFDSTTTGLTGSVSLVAAVTGSIAGGGFTMDVTPIPQVRSRLTYDVSFRVDGGEAMQRSRKHIPSQRVALTTYYVPVERFSLFARFDYRQAATWPEFERVARRSGGLYLHELPDMMLLDVAATKRLWKDHLLATLLIRNVLNEPIRYHPVGAVFNMAFHFSVQVQFNSEAGL